MATMPLFNFKGPHDESVVESDNLLKHTGAGAVLVSGDKVTAFAFLILSFLWTMHKSAMPMFTYMHDPSELSCSWRHRLWFEGSARPTFSVSIHAVTNYIDRGTYRFYNLDYKFGCWNMLFLTCNCVHSQLWIGVFPFPCLFSFPFSSICNYINFCPEQHWAASRFGGHFCGTTYMFIHVLLV